MELDSESFSARENASKELEMLGDLVIPQLKMLSSNSPSLEVKLRAQKLLEKVALAATSPERMRPVRAIEALENIGTPEAIELLGELARGAPGARVTREASAFGALSQEKNHGALSKFAHITRVTSVDPTGAAQEWKLECQRAASNRILWTATLYESVWPGKLVRSVQGAAVSAERAEPT